MEQQSDPYYTDIDNFLVVLDSRNATQVLNDSYNSHMRFDFEEPIFLPRDALKLTCSVLNFTTPNSIYNVNETNAYLHIQYFTILGTNDIMINMVYGNYNANSFMTALSSAITTADEAFATGFSIVLNTTTNKFTLGHSTYSFNFGYDSTIYNIMGFAKNVTYITGENLLNSPYLYTLYAPYTCNFNGTQNMNILIDTFVTTNVDSYNKSFSSIIASVPIDPNQSQISFIKTNNYSFTVKDNVIDVLGISLKDDLARYVNLNNQHWNLTLCFSLVRDISRFSHLNNFSNILRNGY